MATPLLRDVALCLGQALALRNAQLPFHQIDAGDELGDRMLHLQAGVHFHEVEILRFVDQRIRRCPRRRSRPPAPPVMAACAIAARTSSRRPGAGASSMIF